MNEADLHQRAPNRFELGAADQQIDVGRVANASLAVALHPVRNGVPTGDGVGNAMRP